MGSGASLPAEIDEETAKSLAGEKFDKAAFDAAAKEGKIAKDDAIKMAAEKGIAAKPELMYFGLPGRAFAVRVVMFHTFGKDGWVDKRLTFDDYGPQKKAYLDGEPKDLCAAPYMPQLTLPSGRKLAEAVPMSKWAATAKGASPLYPEDPEKRITIDEAIEIIYDCQRAPGGKDEEEKKAKREAFGAGPLKAGLKLYTQKLSASEGPFLLGSQLTLADLWVYFVINMIKVGNMDYVDPKVLDEFPKVMENFKAVCESDEVKKYKEAYADVYTFES